jgi:predicted dehydrogenase
MKKINAGIIGFGIGQKHFEAIENYKKAKVKIICEKNLNKISILKKKFPNIRITNNENEIFINKEINLVSIASYDDDHYPQILKCIKNKKNIIVEKPMCLTVSQLRHIKKLISKSDLKITSNLVLRVNDLFMNIKKKVIKDKIFYIEADYIWGRKNKLFGWRSKIKDYSLILGAGIHVIDLVMWLLKKRPRSVIAVANKIVTSKTVYKKNSMALIILEFPGNIIAKITANAAAIHEHFHEIKIFTSNKTINNTLNGSFTFTKDTSKKNKYSYPDKVNRKRLIQNFLDCIINKNKKAIISEKEQFDLMSVCFAAEDSIKKNKRIKIRYI